MSGSLQILSTSRPRKNDTPIGPDFFPPQFQYFKDLKVKGPPPDFLLLTKNAEKVGEQVKLLSGA